MPTSLQLSTRIVLSGPYNLRPVVNAINKGLAGVKANVNISINKSAVNGIQSVNNVLKSLNNTLSDVARNATTAKSAIQGIASSFTSVSGVTRNANSQINNITRAVNNLGKSTKDTKTDMELFGREAGLAVKRAGAFAIATGAIFGLVRSVKAGISSAIDFERGIVKLAQVTRLSVGGLKSLNEEIDRLSIGLGVSSDELLDVSKILAQAGLSMREVRTALEAVAKSALAPSFDDITNTTEGLIAIMGQFRDELTGTGIVAKDFEKVLGSINAVSAAFAVESDDIVAAIRRTGGVFASASSGIGKPIDQLNELIAVFTSVRSNTRESAETIATGLRTIFTRLQRPQTIDFLRQFGVELTDLNGKFIGPFRAIQQLSEALRNLSPRDLRFALITEELGGIRQVGKLIPAIREFGSAQEALGVAVRGQTSLSEDAAIAQQSLGNQIDKTREAFLKLVRDLTQTDSFQVIARLALSTANAFIKIADSVKELIPLMATLFAARTLRGISEFSSGFIGTFRGGAGFGRGRAGRFATGGLVPGVGNRDDFPAMLTPGEFVIRKAAVQKLGVGRLDRINKFATGGPVTPEEEEFANQFGAFRQDRSKPFNPNTTDRKIANEYLKRFGKNLDITKFLQLQASRKTVAQQTLDRPDRERRVLTLDGNQLSFGGIFLRPQGKADGQGIITETSQFPKILKDKGIDLIRAKVPGYYINQPERTDIENTFDRNIEDAIIRGVKYVANDQSFAVSNLEGIKNRIQTDSIKGALFEGVLSAYGRLTSKGGEANANFDFTGKETQKFAKLFGQPLPNFLDAKLSDTSDARIKIINKAIRQFGPLINDASAQVEKFAKGGSVDSVPALLTPGEYVINKSSAARLGRSTLDRLNRGDVQAFATGGPVNPQATAIAIDQAFRISDAERQLKTAFGTLAKDGAALRVGIDAYRKALQSTKGTLVGLQDELKKGQISQKEFNAATQQRKVDALKVARRAIRGHNAGIAQPTGLEGLFDEAGIGDIESRRIATRGRGFGRSTLLSNRFVRGARGLLNTNLPFLGGTAEQIRERRSLRNARLQNVGFGLLAAGAIAESTIPEPTTSGAARFKGGLSGATFGAGIGLQVAGPLGGAVGALVGGVNGATQAFFEFNKSEALKNMENALQATTSEFEKLIKGTGNIGSFLSNLSNVAKSADVADTAAGQGRSFQIGSLFGQGFRNIGLDFSSNEQLLSSARSSVDANFEARRNAAQTTANQIRELALEGKIDPRTLQGNQIRSLALTDPQAFQRARDKAIEAERNARGTIVGAEAELSIGQRTENLLSKEGERLRDQLVQQADASKRNKEAQEQMEIALREAKSELDLFANRLVKVDEILSTISVNAARADALSGAAITRSQGGLGIASAIGSNIFARPQTGSSTQFRGALNAISGFAGGPETIGLRNSTLELKRFIDEVPNILNDLVSGADVDVNSKASQAQVALSRFNLPPQIVAEARAKISEIVSGAGGGEGKTSEEIRNGIQDVINDLVPLAKDNLQRVGEIYSQVIEAQNRYADALLKATSARKENDNRLFEALQATEEAFIGIGERESGRINVGARFGLQDAAVRRLTGGFTNVGDISGNAAVQQRVLNELERRIVGGTGTQADIEKRNKLVSSLDDNRKALELLSKNTAKLSAVQEKIQEIESRKQTGTSFAERIATGGPAEILKINRGIAAVARFRAGGLAAVGGDREAFGEGLGVVRSLLPELAKEIDEKLRKEVFGGIGGELDKRFGKGLAAEEGLAKATEADLLKEAATASKALSDLASADLADLLRNAATAQFEAAKAVREAAGLIAGAPGRAGGGFISGAGTSTSDSIPARLSNGEFVMSASAVRRYGVGFMQSINNGTADGFARGGFAERRNAIKLASLVRRRGDEGKLFGNDPGFIELRKTIGEFAPRQLALLQRRFAFQQNKLARRNAFRARTGFAEGGLAENAGVTISGEALGALNNFSTTASRLAQAMENIRIPENITMTGTHEVRVVINGAEALNNLLNGPLGNYVEGRIQAALQKHLPAQQRHEGIG